MKRTDRLIVNVSDIKEDGLEVKGELPASVFELSPEDNDRQNCPNPLEYDLRAQRVSNGLLLQGRASTTARNRCDRCLRYYDESVVNSEVCHFVEDVPEGEVDMTEEVREDVLIMLPAKCLCDDECAGLCPHCGQNLNVRRCDCPEPEPGPSAWDQLDDLEL